MLPEETATEDLGLFLSEFLLPGDVVAPDYLFSEPAEVAREVARSAAGTSDHWPRLAPGTTLVPLPLPNGS